jgi:hypothetical protein
MSEYWIIWQIRMYGNIIELAGGHNNENETNEIIYRRADMEKTIEDEQLRDD